VDEETVMDADKRRAFIEAHINPEPPAEG